MQPFPGFSIALQMKHKLHEMVHKGTHDLAPFSFFSQTWYFPFVHTVLLLFLKTQSSWAPSKTDCPSAQISPYPIAISSSIH